MTKNEDLELQMNEIKGILKQITLEGSIDPRYDIDEEWLCLKGGQASVVRGYDKQNYDRVVAIKVGHSADESVYKHFVKEHKLLSKITPHPNIAQIFGHHIGGEERPVLVMEFVSKGTLASQIGKMEKYDLEALMNHLYPISRAIDVIHTVEEEPGKLWVHRDVKPLNILISEEGVPKLADFGHAGLSGSTKSGKGTELYLAPEGFLAGGYDFFPQSDVYSLAVTACEMLVKQNPFLGVKGDLYKFKKNEKKVLKALCDLGMPKKLAEVFLWGMHPDFNKRPYSSVKFLDELKNNEISIDEERLRITTIDKVNYLSENLIQVLSKEPSGLYGVYRFEDIDSIYEFRDKLEVLVKGNGLEEDENYQRAIQFYKEKKESVEATINDVMEKLVNRMSKGLVGDEELTRVKYELGALIHCWPDFGYERFSHAQIGDGTWEGYKQRDKDPSKIGDRTYAKHFEEDFPRK
jgi:serine/threonine protein kinase